MKKLISLLMSLVIVATIFSVLGSLTFTASAESYSVFTEEVLLTFDGDEPYGIPAHRKATLEYVHNDENGYLNISNGKNSGSQSYIGINGSVGTTHVSSASDDTTAKEAAYKALFKCQPGKTYKLQFDYKYYAGTGGSSRDMDVCVMTNPLNSKADSVYSLAKRTTLLESNPASQSWTAVDNALSEDTDWHTAYYIFTVSPDDTEGICVGISPGYNATYETYGAIDNVSICVEGSFLYNESVVHTMDAFDEPFINGSGCTATKVEDAEKGDVLKIVGTGSARGGFTDLKIQKNKKYYVYFDAKSDVDNTEPVFVLGGNGTSSPRYRYFIIGFDKYNDRGVELYVDGEKKTAANVKLSTEWQRYGLIIDTTDETLVNNAANANINKDLWDQNPHFLFGVRDGTAYYDNVQLIEMDNLASAVPETDNASPAYSIRSEKEATNNSGTYQSAGLRFRGVVSNDVKATADEIGVVVIPSSVAVSDSDWYNLKVGTNKAAKKAVWYEKNVKDVIYSVGTDSTAYQLILTKLSDENGKNLYNRRFAAVMYVKSGDNYTYYSLGETSYNETKAKYMVKNVEFELSEKQKEIKLLMIGNSFCSYYTDELYSIAKNAGYKLTVANLYYAGCFIEWHWQWLQEDTPNYTLYVTNNDAGRYETDIKTIREAINATDWDIITLQQHMSLSLMPEYDTVWASLEHVPDLYEYIRGVHPEAKLYWQETWAHEVGFDDFGYQMPDAEYQATVAAVIKQASERVCEENNVPMVPSGDAWVIARQNPVVGDNLCQREVKNDKYHDGDIGGGQYLNACVWFEVLFGKSCVGSTWRPDYDLSEEKIAALQLAAHQAVADVYGSDYAQ